MRLEVLEDDTNKHVKHKKSTNQNEGHEEDCHNWTGVPFWLHVYINSINPSIHDINPAINTCNHKQCLQCLPKVVKIVVRIYPRQTSSETLCLCVDLSDSDTS